MNLLLMRKLAIIMVGRGILDPPASEMTREDGVCPRTNRRHVRDGGSGGPALPQNASTRIHTLLPMARRRSIDDTVLPQTAHRPQPLAGTAPSGKYPLGFNDQKLIFCHH